MKSRYLIFISSVIFSTFFFFACSLRPAIKPSSGFSVSIAITPTAVPSNTDNQSDSELLNKLDAPDASVDADISSLENFLK